MRGIASPESLKVNRSWGVEYYFAQQTKGEVECTLEGMNERQTSRKAG